MCSGAAGPYLRGSRTSRPSCYDRGVTEGHSFGRYRVTKPLGKGAMGEVYEAVDDVLGREVAIKTLNANARAELIGDRFRHEARAIAQLSHPGIVQLFDIDLTAQPPYLVMERVSGPSLDERLEAGPLRVEELVPLGIQIARALAAAHAAGIVHRDVKPANVLAAGAGTWKLADFGVAHVPDSSLTITGQFVGSPAYSPPEALVKGVSAPTGDIYGLGATLYEAACGRWPRAEAQGALLAPVPPLRELAPELPAAVAAAIDRAVAFQPDQRPTAAELAEALAHGAIADPPVAAAVSMPAVPRSRPLRWQPYAIGGGLALALVVGWALRRPSAPAPAALPAPPMDNATQEPDDDSGDLHELVEHIQRDVSHGHYDGARHKLDDYERDHGESDATRALRQQLDVLGPEPHGPPHGKHHGHD